MKKLLLTTALLMTLTAQAHAINAGDIIEFTIDDQTSKYYVHSISGGSVVIESRKSVLQKLDNRITVKVTDLNIVTNYSELSELQKKYGFEWDFGIRQKIGTYATWFSYYSEVVNPKNKAYFKRCARILQNNYGTLYNDAVITRTQWTNDMTLFCS